VAVVGPNCKTEMRILPKYCGRQFACPKCQAAFIVPQLATATPVVAAPPAVTASPIPSQSAITPTIAPSEPEASGLLSQAVGIGTSLLVTIKTVAVLVTKHIQLKTLTWDLNRADTATGIEAYGSRIGTQQFSDQYDRIVAIDEEVAAKQKAEPIPPNESMTAKAKRMAYRAKNKVVIEALLSRRQGCLRELGERLRSLSDSPETQPLQDKLKQARNAHSRVDNVKAEIASLSQKSPRVMKNAVLFAAVVGLLLVGYCGYGFFAAAKDNYNSASSAERYYSDLVATGARKANETLVGQRHLA